MDRQEELLTLAEMAERLKVKTSWLYQRTRLRGANSIPRIMCGKYIRFDPDAVMAWIKRTYQGGTA